MNKLVRDFGSGCTARGVVELSGFAKALDIGLIGTAVEHLDSNQASIGIGVRSNDTTSSASANRSGETPDLSGEDFIPDEDITGISKSKGKSSATKYVRPKGIIALARLARRYLGRELDKGPVRLSNWDKILSADQKYCESVIHPHQHLCLLANLTVYSRRGERRTRRPCYIPCSTSYLLALRSSGRHTCSHTPALGRYSNDRHIRLTSLAKTKASSSTVRLQNQE